MHSNSSTTWWYHLCNSSKRNISHTFKKSSYIWMICYTWI